MIKKVKTRTIVASSYRDPSGFVFTSNNNIYRQISLSYKDNYELLISSCLYNKLVEKELLVSHKEIHTFPLTDDAYKIIEPEQIPFISYPYEWCFSQLKDAALTTLKIQKEALNFGMSLKDASSFNIQFLSGKPILIDTLSFEKYEEGKPWIAYKQFCEQFLAPLALFSYTDMRLSGLLKTFIEGIPLDLTAKLLPATAKVKFSLLFHIILHARSQKKFEGDTVSKKSVFFGKHSLLGLIDSLENAIKNLSWRPSKTVWTDYYTQSNKISYDTMSLIEKKSLVKKYLEVVLPKTLWDIGANSGLYSQIAASLGISTISMDSDPSVVEQNYQEVKKTKEKNIFPLVINIANPTPSIGFENQERLSLLSRPRPDAVLALALIHHLAIGNNLPFSKLAKFFNGLCRDLIIEFIPKEDKQAKLLLQNREDIFENYQQAAFESEFGQFFQIQKKTPLTNSKRILYLMVNKKK